MCKKEEVSITSSVKVHTMPLNGAEECGSEYLERSEVNHWFCNRGLICSSKKTVVMDIASHRAVETARDVLISYGYSILQKRDPSRTLV